jgi:hypothetical protein
VAVPVVDVCADPVFAVVGAAVDELLLDLLDPPQPATASAATHPTAATARRPV